MTPSANSTTANQRSWAATDGGPHGCVLNICHSPGSASATNTTPSSSGEATCDGVSDSDRRQTLTAIAIPSVQSPALSGPTTPRGMGTPRQAIVAIAPDQTATTGPATAVSRSTDRRVAVNALAERIIRSGSSTPAISANPTSTATPT